MSEKMDGIRAYWDGKKFISKNGKCIFVPSKFSKGLPSVALDGEIWMGRGTYEKLTSLLKSNISNSAIDKWNEVGYYIFDLPSSSAPYEERLDKLQNLQLPTHVHLVKSIRCNDFKHLNLYLDEILNGGGEGIILREPNSIYTVGLISSSFLKLKRIDDTEVILTEVMNTGLFCQQYHLLNFYY